MFEMKIWLAGRGLIPKGTINFLARLNFTPGKCYDAQTPNHTKKGTKLRYYVLIPRLWTQPEKIGKIYSSRVFRFQYITPKQSSFQISHLFVVSNFSHLGVILQLPLLFYTHFIAKFLFALLFYTHLGY